MGLILTYIMLNLFLFNVRLHLTLILQQLDTYMVDKYPYDRSKEGCGWIPVQLTGKLHFLVQIRRSNKVFTLDS